MLGMIIKMSAVAILYILVTVGIWYWTKTKSPSTIFSILKTPIAQ